MSPRLMLDTHVIVRWLIEPKRLSREQSRAIEDAVQRREPLGLSAISLLEIATLSNEGRIRLQGGVDQFFAEIQGTPSVQLLPLSYEIASQAGSLSVLRDPADRVIAATAMVHRLRLVTSDQRIIASHLVSTIE